MVRRALFVVACVLVALALSLVVVVFVVPVDRFFEVNLGRYTVGLDCFALNFYRGDLMFIWIPLPILTVGAGVPAGLYLGAVIGSRLRKSRRGFPIDVTPSPR